MPGAGRPRLVLVHGSVVGGRATWREQRRNLADDVELVVLERPGFDVRPVPGFGGTAALAPIPRVDFDEHAGWVAARMEPRDHLVGHSYGGVIALLAAGRRRDLASLTVIEPPCTRVVLDDPVVAEFARLGAGLYASGASLEPEVFLRQFLAAVGSRFDPPSPLPPALELGARLLQDERGPWEADIPLETLAKLELGTLVVSGAHHPAFDAICDRLEEALSAERLVLPGFGHNAQLHPDFNAALLGFVRRRA